MMIFHVYTSIHLLTKIIIRHKTQNSCTIKVKNPNEGQLDAYGLDAQRNTINKYAKAVTFLKVVPGTVRVYISVISQNKIA